MLVCEVGSFLLVTFQIPQALTALKASVRAVNKAHYTDIFFVTGDGERNYLRGDLSADCAGQ